MVFALRGVRLVIYGWVSTVRGVDGGEVEISICVLEGVCACGFSCSVYADRHVYFRTEGMRMST